MIVYHSIYREWGGREGGREGSGQADIIIVVLLAHTKRLRQVGMV